MAGSFTPPLARKFRHRILARAARPSMARLDKMEPFSKLMLRRQVIEARIAMSAQERHEHTRLFSRHLLAALAEFPHRQTRRIAAYAPLPLEPGETDLPQTLYEAGFEVLLPLWPARQGGVSPQGIDDPMWTEFVDSRMSKEIATSITNAQETLLTPLPSEVLDSVELVIVPALAVDERGARLGRGGGWYDRALTRSRARTVALVFDDEFVPHLPVEPHDQPMSAVITPTHGWRELPLALE